MGRKWRSVLTIMILFTLLSCAAPEGGTAGKGGQKAGHGFSLALKGIGQLILAPLQIAAGLLEGIASIPYFLSTSLQDINKGMISAQAKITLDDTYESAYGKRLSAVPASGDTGEVFRRMKHATEYFQKVLSRYGIRNADHYILVSIDTANNMGYTLFAVVYRPQQAIRVIDKYDGQTIRNFDREDRLYYEPFERDASGKVLDTIIDWAGLPRDFILTQKAQALMMTLAANAVVNEKRSPDYWDIEKRWIAGDYLVIVEQKMNSVKNKMQI